MNHYEKSLSMEDKKKEQEKSRIHQEPKSPDLKKENLSIPPANHPSDKDDNDSDEDENHYDDSVKKE